MDLNLSIIKNELPRWDLRSAGPEDPCRFDLAWPELLEEWPASPRGDVLYILEADLLPERPPTGAGALSALLCSGRPPEAWLAGEAQIVYAEESGGAPTMMNEVCRIFARYRRWEQTLQRILDENCPLREMGEATSRLLGSKNPIWAIGASFQYIFSYVAEVEPLTPQIRRLLEEHPAQSGDGMTAEEIQEFLTDPEYQEAISATEPTIYSGINEGYRTLSYNVAANNILLARIGFQEISARFTSRDFAVIRILGRYLKKALVSKGVNAFDRPVGMDETLRALAANLPVFGENIAAVLKHCLWQEDDRFVCLSLRLRGREGSPQAMTEACLLLASLLGNDCYTVFEDRIVYVFNLTRTGMSRDRLWETLLPILRDNLLEAGISTTFDRFRRLPFFFRQAETARALGVRKNPTYWYFRYEDYQMEDLLSRYLRDTVPDTLIPDGLKVLLEHDRKKKSDYVSLLRMYLECERNIAETIRRAYIHRNTFLYRIGRIEKLLGMDLESHRNRLILEMAFQVIDFRRQEQENYDLRFEA